MKKTVTFLMLLLFSIAAFSQSDEDIALAESKALLAIQVMDKGEYDLSIKMLSECCKLDPKNYSYPYEIGYAYYLKKEYKKSIKWFKKVVKMETANDQCFQMLGNIYDMSGDSVAAVKTYKEGLTKFPESGRLYLEMGNMNLNNLSIAIEYYEKGIAVEPSYPSNYYWATRIYCQSTEEIWGLLYGEIFMNIERGTKRTEEISRLLYNTYKSQISFSSDSTISVSFCLNHELLGGNNKSALPFTMVFEPLMMIAIGQSADTICIESLSKVRASFIDLYFDGNYDTTHPNVLFQWHKSLIEEGYFDTYNRWIFMQGALTEFDAWYAENTETFDDFIYWFSDNPMKIDKNNKFHRVEN